VSNTDLNGLFRSVQWPQKDIVLQNEQNKTL